MDTKELGGTVALVTGAASGIGAAVARRLAALGAHVVAADVDDAAGEVLAEEVGGHYVHCDVRDLAANEAAVAVAVEEHGGLDLAFLNAGVTTGCSIGEGFDLDLYRRAMAVNLDGVVLGAQAALPALRARGGGAIVATASVAGLVPMALEPIYSANKHAVVGFARSLGQLLGPEGITVNALCPSFADTPLVTEIKPFLADAGFPVLDVEAVVEGFLAILDGGRTGEAWFVIPGRTPEPYRFGNVPGPLSD